MIEDEKDEISNSTEVTVVVEPPKSVRPKEKLGFLEGIRGWAALSVAIFHMFGGIYRDLDFRNDLSRPPWQTFVFRLFIWTGRLSVTIFFILSGRVIANGYLKAKDPARLVSSAIRRPFRLYIPVLVSFLLYYLFQVFGWINPNIEKASQYNRPGAIWYGPQVDIVYPLHLFIDALYVFIPPYNGPFFAPIIVYWTIPHEFTNSYIVYLVALITQTVPKRRWSIYFIIIYIDVWNNLNSWTAPFIIGLAIADLAQTGYFHTLKESRKGLYLKIGLILLTFSLWTIDFWVLSDLDGEDGKASVLVAWLRQFTFYPGKGELAPPPNGRQISLVDLTIATCILLLAEISPLMQRVFGSRIMLFLGKISFGIYLLHPLIFVSSSALVFSLLFNPGANLSDDWAKIILIIATLAALFPFAWLFYYIADKPSISAGRLVEKHWLNDGDGFQWHSIFRNIMMRFNRIIK